MSLRERHWRSFPSRFSAIGGWLTLLILNFAIASPALAEEKMTPLEIHDHARQCDFEVDGGRYREAVELASGTWLNLLRFQSWSAPSAIPPSRNEPEPRLDFCRTILSDYGPGGSRFANLVRETETSRVWMAEDLRARIEGRAR